MNFLVVSENLKDVLSEEVGSRVVYDKDVAAALGMSSESYAQLKRRNSIPYEAIACFCGKRNISINWILFNQLPKSLEENTEKYARIKYFKDVYTSAGGGAWNERDNYEYINIQTNLPKQYTDNFHIINVIGDSMEPTLKDKELIVCDRNQTQIQNNQIYIINTPNSGLLVKRLNQKDENIEVISDNQNYKKEILNIHQDIEIVGRVIGRVE